MARQTETPRQKRFVSPPNSRRIRTDSAHFFRKHQLSRSATDPSTAETERRSVPLEGGAPYRARNAPAERDACARDRHAQTLPAALRSDVHTGS